MKEGTEEGRFSRLEGSDEGDLVFRFAHPVGSPLQPGGGQFLLKLGVPAADPQFFMIFDNLFGDVPESLVQFAKGNPYGIEVDTGTGLRLCS